MSSKTPTSHDATAEDIPWNAPWPSELHASGPVLTSSSTVHADGTLQVEFSSSSPEELDKLLPPLPSPSTGEAFEPETPCPPLHVLIQVVGSRGKKPNAPTPAFTFLLTLFVYFVRKSGLEFFPIGGDPEDLMAYMVKNPGLIPSLSSLKEGDVSRKRKMIFEMLNGCWQSCIQPDLITGRPFVADAIIANPPSFAHVHCAQALGIPVHIMFTMPWTATREFPHPLANVASDNVNPKTSNYLSYGVVDWMTWQGLGDVINGWRRKELFLEPLSASMGPDIVGFLKVPHTYCWSPALVPKPADWGAMIDICGFFMRDEPQYSPPDDLARFLAAGPAPIYVGFGSIVLENPQRITQTILDACRAAGVRVIISRGWSKLGGDSPSTSDVFYLGDCPHEWLFKQVAAVVHHGGAGTTACGLYNARPTVIVPFFGDQPFWGAVVAARGAGPSPISHKLLNAQNLTKSITYCLSDAAREAARQISDSMRQEHGVDNAIKSFHSHLGVSELTCDLLPGHTASWTLKKRHRTLKVSNAALHILVAEKLVNLSEVKAYRSRQYNTDTSRWDPLTAGASSVLGTATDATTALGGTFVGSYKAYKRVRSGGGDNAGLAVATAAGKGLGSMTTTLAKGGFVTLPVAVTDGLRNVPALYGDKVEDHGKVTDWKSGGIVGAKNLGYGMYQGVTGFVTKPIEGAKAEGTIGLMKGLGKGTLELFTKSSSGMFGMLAYPAQGVYKSIKAMDRKSFYRLVEAGRRDVFEREQSERVLSGNEKAQIVSRYRAIVAE
ncbi:sterol glucosyltransferase [Fusarium agapanthi]|uniref:Sterol glucosyltransferase n=1 Tax=Fusarium agapanthi TaxID=1803897 RepID=A0A9P5B8H1_9HYPO|nr:sterol glucosyltransferase [Fusarium agapanthi]